MRPLIALLLLCLIGGPAWADERIVVVGCLIAEEDKHQGQNPFFYKDPNGWRGHVMASQIIGFQEFKPSQRLDSLDCVRVLLTSSEIRYLHIISPRHEGETSAEALKRILDRR